MNAPNNDVEKAKEDVRAAEREIKQAAEEMRHAERDLERAEHELEEAEKHEIHFEVDGEPYTTTQRRWTPNGIIEKFAEKDPKTHYLVRIKEGSNEESYRDKGDIEIELHNGECFQVILIGPTPVSDGPPKTGPAAFVAGLQEMGYAPTLLPGTTDHVVFDYPVKTGKLSGTSVRLGFIVPAEFPAVLPSGPCVSPPIHPTRPDNSPHPTGGIHEGQAAAFRVAGGDWQYWSRTYNGLPTVHQPVKTYMNFIWNLWDTQ